jgi:hypothetical protein
MSPVKKSKFNQPDIMPNYRHESDENQSQNMGVKQFTSIPVYKVTGPPQIPKILGNTESQTKETAVFQLTNMLGQ